VKPAVFGLIGGPAPATGPHKLAILTLQRHLELLDGSIANGLDSLQASENEIARLTRELQSLRAQRELLSASLDKLKE